MRAVAEPSVRPTKGRNVHLTTQDGRCLAGMVTFVPEGDERADCDPIVAVVFEESGQLSSLTGCRAYRGEPGEVHTWHWPERA